MNCAREGGSGGSREGRPRNDCRASIKLYAAHRRTAGRCPVANAGRGLGKAFLDQDFDDIRHVIDTNVTGTVYLIHKVGRDMRARGRGPHPDHRLDRRLHAGHLPGGLQRHQGVSRFVLLCASREELKDSGVTVTCLMPGATETEFFERADMLDTKVGTREEGRCRRCRQERLRSDDGGRGRCGERLAEQAARGGRACAAVGDAREGAHQPRGAGDGKEVRRRGCSYGVRRSSPSLRGATRRSNPEFTHTSWIASLRSQ